MTQAQHCVSKVVAYITRSVNEEAQLLVFEHSDFPDAGIQVPAGTVQEDELIPMALLREVNEETGLTQFVEQRLLTQYKWFCEPRNEWHDRHVFHFVAAGAPDQWDHTVDSTDEDEGMVFRYYWAPLSDVPKPTGNQDDWLHLLSNCREQ